MIPQLNHEDMEAFDLVLGCFLAKSGADAALLVERAGYLIRQRGQLPDGDPVQIATLAANAFAATEMVACLLREPDFRGMHQEGATTSTLTLRIDDACLLFVAFSSFGGVGDIRHCAGETLERLAAQLQTARNRGGKGLDLAGLNPRDARELFGKEGGGT